MELNFRSDIKSWLDNASPLTPILPEQLPALKTKSNSPAKAVIFDIYGTLLISSSGDIDQASLSGKNMFQALKAGGYAVEESAYHLFNFLLEELKVQINKQHDKLKKKGHPFPDVDIFKVWKNMIKAAEAKTLIEINGTESIADTIIVFEILSNRVFPMPGMREILQYLRNKEIPIGIVSNAQFYTPIIMNYFLKNEFSAAQEIEGFKEDLCVYSFKELRAKPDTALFDKLKPTLSKKYNIAPNECIFVGNDMLKDIYTASASGFKTVLFAGDQRSLRLRTSDARTQKLTPDFVIHQLSQLKEIV